MSSKGYKLEGSSTDFIMAWFVATRKAKGYDWDRPFIGAVVYDPKHYRHLPVTLTQYDSTARRFKKLFPNRYEMSSGGDGSEKKPFFGFLSKKTKQQIMGVLRRNFKAVAWIKPEKSGWKTFVKAYNARYRRKA